MSEDETMGGPIGERVLVTGAAGFVGTHVVKELLSRGKYVRATARNPAAAGHLQSLENTNGGGLEIVKMDLFNSDSVDSAVKECNSIIHCAAELYVGAKDKQKDVVDPSIIGTNNLISAIEKCNTISKIIHTSSVAAIRPTNYSNGQTLTVNDWCDDATLKSNAYGLAKAGAEKIMRQWWEDKGAKDSGIRLITIHPSIVIGPILAKRHVGGSMSYVDHLVKGSPPFTLKSHINMVDVRDVAIAHVNALSLGNNGQRYLLHAGSLWQRDMANILRESIQDGNGPGFNCQKPLLMSFLYFIQKYLQGG
jgi:dihydroflavonol-4-reductase